MKSPRLKWLGDIPNVEQLEAEARTWTKFHVIPKIVLSAIAWTETDLKLLPVSSDDTMGQPTEF